MLGYHQLINLLHIIFVAPLLILLATNNVPQRFMKLIILIAIIVMIFHSYKLFSYIVMGKEHMEMINGSKVHYIKLYDSHPGYDRQILNIKEGEVVVWTNVGAVEHTVTEVNNEFNSGYMKPGDSFSIKFHQKGTFDYYSIPQKGWMLGKIIVS